MTTKKARTYIFKPKRETIKILDLNRMEFPNITFKISNIKYNLSHHSKEKNKGLMRKDNQLTLILR